MATLRIEASALLLLLLGCGLAAPSSGAVVGPGVAQARFEVRANQTDLVGVEVLFPAAASGAPLPGPHPGVVFIQGGLVAASRYHWQAKALAARGYVVAVPEHPLDLAFFSVDNGAAARRLFLEPPRGSLLVGLVDPARLAVAGHSLGGVVAMKLALAGGFQAVVLEASFPDGADVPALAGFHRPSLSLAGALDCSARLASVRQGWESLPPPSALQVLAGVTHYQFTDAETEDRQRGCPPTATLDEAHAAVADSLAAFLDGALADGGLGEAGLRAVSGTTLEVRP
jgi:dienelactone hydrolase